MLFLVVVGCLTVGILIGYFMMHLLGCIGSFLGGGSDYISETPREESEEDMSAALWMYLNGKL